ncbi:MAG: 30S ribosome-binding factor RbfA [Eubacteriales bacterium]|jgi:ribosome-binding factor A
MQKRPHYHINRVNEDIARELTSILRNVKDPRVTSGFVSVTKTETTPDLKFCKVYYSNLGGNDKDVKTGLYSAIGYIRRELANRLSLRNTPELTFVKDTGAEHGARISELLKEIEDEKTQEPSEETESEHV